MPFPPSKLKTFYRTALNVYLFVLVLIMYAGTNDPTIHIKTFLTTWSAGLLAGTFLVIAWVTRIPLRRPPIFQGVLLCLLGFFLLSSFFSEFRAISLLETSRFFALFALYWVASQIYSESQHVARTLLVFVVAVSLAACYAMLQWVGLDPFPWTDTVSDTYTNLPATFGNPNFAAHALILAIISIFGLSRMGHRWPLWFLPILFLHLYRTDQRAGWIAMAAAALLVAVGWVLLRKTKQPAWAVLSTIVLVGLLGVGALGGAMKLSQARTGHAFPLDLSLLLRYQSYVSATNMVLDAPVLGHGPAVYGLAYAPYWTTFEKEWFAQEGRMNEHVHNDLIELAIDGGLPAAGLYLAALILAVCYGLLLFARGSTNNQRKLGLLFAGLFTAFAVDGLFGFNLRVPVTAAFFFLLLGLLDGIWSRTDDTPAPHKIWVSRTCRIAFLVILILSMRLETKSFASDYNFYSGMQAQHHGHLAEARQAYERSEQLAPWNWHAPRRIAMTLLDDRKAEESMPHLQRALQKNPYYLNTRIPMARANFLLAQAALQPNGAGIEAARTFLNEAREQAEIVRNSVPNMPVVDDILGRVESIAAIIEGKYTAEPNTEQEQAHWRAARDHLTRAIEYGALDPSSLYLMLVQIEQSLHNPEGAERALLGVLQSGYENDEKVWTLFIELARESTQFTTLRSALYRRIDELKSDESTDNIEKRENALSTAYLWLGTVQLEGFKDTTNALDAYLGATEAAPQRAETWSRLAGLAYETNQPSVLEKRVVNYGDMATKDGQSLLPQLEAAWIALRDEDATTLNTASRLLLAGVRAHVPSASITPRDTFSWSARLLLDRYHVLADEGKADCETALNLGIISASIREFNAAENLFSTAAACASEERKAITAIHWADTMLRTDRASDALAMLSNVESEFPNNREIQWALARTLAQLGDVKKSRQRYDNLLDAPDIDPQGRKLLELEREALDARSPSSLAGE